MPRYQKPEPAMTDKQAHTIVCALADLVGAMQAHVDPRLDHDWAGHMDSIRDLAAAFPQMSKDYASIIERLTATSWYADNITLGVLADGNTK